MKHHLRGTESKGSHLQVVLYVDGAVVIGNKKAVYFPGGGGIKPELDRWDWLSNPATVARVLPPGSM